MKRALPGLVRTAEWAVTKIGAGDRTARQRGCSERAHPCLTWAIGPGDSGSVAGAFFGAGSVPRLGRAENPLAGRFGRS